MEEIVKVLTELLAQALPYLKQAGGTAFEEASKKLGEDAWARAKDLWAKLRPKVEANSSAAEAATDLAANPQDADTQAAFRHQLKKILAADENLATDLAQLIKAAGPKTSYQAEARNGGVVAQDGSVAAHEVAVGHDVHGNVIVLRIDADRMDPGRLLDTIMKHQSNVDLTDATARYLDYLVNRYRYLEISGYGYLRSRAPETPADGDVYPLEGPHRHARG